MNTTTKTPSQLAEDAARRPTTRSTRPGPMRRTRSMRQAKRFATCAARPSPRSSSWRRACQQAVQRGLDAASTTSARAQRRLEAAADVTGKYIADQPVRSVLVAAAAGAAITALIVLASRRRDDY